MIQPALIGALRECLLEICPPNTHTNHEEVLAMLSEHHQLIYSRLEEIKESLGNPRIMQQQIQDGVLGGTGFCGPKALLGSSESTHLPNLSHAESCEETAGHQEIASAVGVHEESLSEV
jgi:hypothetical protein